MNEPRRPADWDDLYPGRFMKAGQLGERKHVFTIADVIIEELETDDGGKKDRGIICFQETPFQLALNKTNGYCLKAMFGRATQAWIGKKVALFQSPVESGSMKGQPAIRIYGSPDLTQDIEIRIKHPKKKAYPWTLHGPRQQRAAAPGNPPPQKSEGGNG